MNNEYKNEIAEIAYENEKELLAIKRRYRAKYLRFKQRYEYVQNEWFYRVDKIATQRDYQKLKKKYEHLKSEVNTDKPKKSHQPRN